MKLELKERDALIFAIGIALFIAFLTIIVLNGGIKSLNSQIKTKQAEYDKALALYNKIKKEKSGKKVFNGDILIFVQKLEAINGIKNKIVSVNTISANNGVDIRMAGLNLTQLMSIFNTISQYKNIQIYRFTLKRNFSDKNLINLDIVLRKAV